MLEVTLNSKPYRAAMAELDQGVISEGRIKGILKALHARDRLRAGYSIGVTSPSISNQQLNKIIERIETEKPRVTNVQAEKGLKYLRNLHHSPLGKVRKNNPFTDAQAQALTDQYFSHFTLEGFDELDQGYRSTAFYPIYRVHAVKGLGLPLERGFSYSNGSWQNGKPLEIFD